jgi:hypothetical protein
MILEFSDPAGGFFTTGRSGEKLIARLKDPYDGALPSGNSAAALTLLRLGEICSRADFTKSAEETLRSFARSYARSPEAYPYHLCALDALLGPSQQIVLAGDGELAERMLREIRRTYLPNAIVVRIPSEGPDPRQAKLIPLAQGRSAIGSRTTAFVCENSSCLEPVHSLEDLRRLLARLR